MHVMAGTTEIYLCTEGQSVKEGKLVYSSSVETKAEAESDALRRCGIDPSLAKIAYYTVDEDGSFNNFYTYRNPNPATPSGSDAEGAKDAPKGPSGPYMIKRPNPL